MWRPDDPQGFESEKIKYLIVPYTRGKVLDVGCGARKAFAHFVGVDNCVDTALFGTPIRPDVRVNSAIDLPFKDASHDAVFSSHTLEHIADYRAALAEWWRVIRPGGHLVLYLPHADLYPNIGEPGANPDHKHDFQPEDIRAAMADVAVGGMELLVDEARNEGREYSFLQVYRKRDDGVCHVKPRIEEKTVCVVRFGGFGDMLQAASALPELRRQGFRVTVMTTPAGQGILRHDPHVDDWIIQDKDQVPNAELTPYFAAMATRFTRFVNLCESVEGTLLALPGRANHAWPDAVRRKRLNVNYLEFTAELARVPFTAEARFYASEDEAREVETYFERHFEPDEFRVLWALAGSSVHKFYPWQDAVIARVLEEIPEARIVLTGDVACQLLEQGWEEEPRVLRESGKQTIRQTLAMAQRMHCVVGPETGVLNAVGFEPDVAKVCLLSHSTVENLTKHWLNTASIVPEGVACYPCHRLHYTREFCPEHEESGAAMCQASIDPGRVFEAIAQAYSAWEARHASRQVA